MTATDVDMKTIYSRWKDWVKLSTNARYNQAMSVVGGEGTMASYFTLLDGWRIRPMEMSHTFNLYGIVEVYGGGDPVVPTLGNYNVLVKNTIPLQATVVTVSSGSGLSTEQDTKLTQVLAAAQAGTALEVWGKQIEGTYTAEQVLRLMASVLGGKLTGAGTGYEVFRDLSDTKDRITATVDNSGNRTAIALDVS